MISPDDVRDVQFPRVGRLKRGLDPKAVYDFLVQLSDEIDQLNNSVRSAREESQRVRDGLRSWYQGQPTQLLPIIPLITKEAPPRTPPNRGRLNRRGI